MATYDAAFPSQDFLPRIKENFCIIVVGVIVKENQVLLIQEAKRSCYGKYFLPAGRLEPHETILDGVKREVREESGVEFEPKRLVLLESNGSCWLSITFLGDVIGGQLKTVPDSESLQARWFDLDEVRRLEAEWHSLYRARISRSAAPRQEQQQRQSSVQLRAPILHMIEAALRFHRRSSDDSITQRVPLPTDYMEGLWYMVYRLAVIWTSLDATTAATRKPSHLLVRDVHPARLPTFRLNGIDPPRAIELALQTALSAQVSPQWDAKHVGILNMTFVPRRSPDARESSTPSRSSDGFLLTLRIPLIQTNPNCDLPKVTNGYRWIELDSEMPTCLDAADQQFYSLIQCPLETDVLPLFHF